MVQPFKQKLWSVTTASRGRENICPGHQFQLSEAMDIVMDESAEEQPQMCEANQVFPTLDEAKLRAAIDAYPPDQTCPSSFRDMAMTEVKIQVTNARKRKIGEVEEDSMDEGSAEGESVEDVPWSTTQYFDPAWEAQIKGTKVIPWGK